MPSAEPDYPTDGATDSEGWTTVSGVYRAPAKATRAVVELHLQWAPKGESNGARSCLKNRPAPASQGAIGHDSLPTERQVPTGEL